MTSKEALKIIRSYHDEMIYHSDYAFIEIENIFKQELDIIEKDLDRLEKITDILKDKLSVYEKAQYRLSVNGSLEYQEVTNQEYELLKEVLENDK